MCVKPLSTLLAGFAEVPSVFNLAVHGLSADSRQLRAGDAFVALKGSAGDSWRYVDAAIERGAIAVLLETDGETGCSEQGSALVVKVPQLTQHQAALADRFFDAPSQALHVIGVTGTNGKSSVTRYIAQILNNGGLKTATLGTLGYGFSDSLAEASHTTPDVISVHRWLHVFRQQGASAVVMEVSSHALDQGRVAKVHFEGAVYTNLSRDHLDYHGTMEEYGAAKASLFTNTHLRFAIINADDQFGRQLSEKVSQGCQVWRYTSSADASAELRLRQLNLRQDGFDAVLETPSQTLPLSSNLLGHFNACNITAAVGAALALNIEPAVIAAAVKNISAPAGRLQRFSAEDGLRVVVDYAHSPAALETALNALAAHVKGNLWCVFGCGGDRDSGKRPLMGEIAERLANAVVLTDDNPRSEDPEAIVQDILGGMAGQANVHIEHDRAAAIEYAVHRAGSDDLILVAGKGHETYQAYDGQKRDFSDILTVQELINRRSARGLLA